MSVDFADLLNGWLPGLYRDKDGSGELERFLEIAAGPLTEISASVEQLRQDFFITGCRDAFIPLIGKLIGVELDPTQPAFAQRAEVSEALQFYRQKGLRDTLATMAAHLTRLPVQTADFSQMVALAPFLQDADPLVPLRRQPIGEKPAGSGNFFFRADQALQPLYDSLRGRAITRHVLAGHEASFAGVDGLFSIRERGADIFSRAQSPYTTVAANLTDFANPKTPAGAVLTIAANQVAVDPELGRFRIVSPLPLAGNLTVDYQALAPSSLARQTFDLREPNRMRQLGRIDDPAPYTLDLRAPRAPSDKIGRMHFDNHGFFFTLGRIAANRKPNQLAPGRFTFDDRPLAQGDTQGVSLQLLDGIDGAPLTRRKLQGHETEFCGTPRGFTIRVNGTDIITASLRPRAANLTDFAQPKDASGANLVLAAGDIAIDPQLGRFLLNLAPLNATPDQVRVDYFLGPSLASQNQVPGTVASTVAPTLFSFAPDARPVLLRDGFDGTPIPVKIRLGRPAAEFHGTPRGWIIQRNGTSIGGSLTPELKSLSNPITLASPGAVAIDADLGRFRFPAGFLAAGDQVTVSYSAEDSDGEDRIMASYAQRQQKMLPAGVVGVIIDTRKTPVNPAVLL